MCRLFFKMKIMKSTLKEDYYLIVLVVKLQTSISSQCNIDIQKCLNSLYDFRIHVFFSDDKQLSCLTMYNAMSLHINSLYD